MNVDDQENLKIIRRAPRTRREGILCEQIRILEANVETADKAVPHTRFEEVVKQNRQFRKEIHQLKHEI